MVERIGNCRILGEIGSGGMAVVYKAVQEPLGRTVAIKALKPSIAVDSQFAKRFEREAHFMASLQHENILHVYDFIKDGRTMYIVMEYVQGIDLYDLLERTPAPAGRGRGDHRAAGRARARLRALPRDHPPRHQARERHDLASGRGEADGLRHRARRRRSRDLTETGTGLGTPSYMSPEQILGDKLDFRIATSSRSASCSTRCITGRKPFVEDDARTVMQKIRLDRYTSAAQAQRRRAAHARADPRALHGEDAGEPVPDARRRSSTT